MRYMYENADDLCQGPCISVDYAELMPLYCSYLTLWGLVMPYGVMHLVNFDSHNSLVPVYYQAIT